MNHSKFNTIKTIVENNFPVLLQGSAGSGKSTVAKDIAKELDLPFFSMSMTKQTTVSNIIGFISINGNYIPTQFRKAFENGGLVLLDEIDASDPNTLLCLNTIENGYMSFPDGVIHRHEDFRLIATANPSNEHTNYTGRSKLDFATLDRFMQVELLLDPNLEESLVGVTNVRIVRTIRKLLVENGVTQPITMRDSIRYAKLSTLDIMDNPLQILFKQETELMKVYMKDYKPAKNTSTFKSVDEVYNYYKGNSYE